MWRALFLAIGIFCCVLGAECLALDKAVMKRKVEQTDAMGHTVQATREVEPPDWAPWTLLSTGAILIIYSFTIPKRVGS